MATDFKSMKRKQLQALCKQHGLPAGKSNLQLADSLAALILLEERSKRRGCLTGSGGRSGEGLVMPKKVRFSIEEEKVRPDRRKRNSAAVAEKVGVDSPVRDAGVPVRRTRSRSLDVVLWSPGIQMKARRGTEGVCQNVEVVRDKVPAARSLSNMAVVVGGGEVENVQRGLETRRARKRTRGADKETPAEKKSSSHAPATRSLRSRNVVVGGEEALLLAGDFEQRRTPKRRRLANGAEDVEASLNGVLGDIRGALHNQPEGVVSGVAVVSEIGRQKVPPREEAPLRRSRRTLSKRESSLLEKENPGTDEAGVEEASLRGGGNIGYERVTVRRNKAQKHGDITALKPGTALLSETTPAEVLQGKNPELREPLRRSIRNSRLNLLGNEISVPAAGDVKAIGKKIPGKQTRNVLLVREVVENSGPKFVVATETEETEKEKKSEVEECPRRSTRSSTRVVPENEICVTTCENVGEDDIPFKNMRKRPRKLQLARETMQNPAYKSEPTTTVASPGGKVSDIKEPLKGSTDYPVHNIPKISVPAYGNSGDAVKAIKNNKRGKQARNLRALKEAIENYTPTIEAAKELETNEVREEAPSVVQPQVAPRRSRRNARDNDVSMFVGKKPGDDKQASKQQIVKGAIENYASNVDAATELEAGEVQEEAQIVVHSEVAPRRSSSNARDPVDSRLVDQKPGGDDMPIRLNKLWQLPDGGDLKRQGVQVSLISNRNGKQKRKHDGYWKIEDKCILTRQGPSSKSVSVKDEYPLNFSSSGGPANEVFDTDSSFVVGNGNTEVGDCKYLVEKKVTQMQQSMLLDDFGGGPVQIDQMKTFGSGMLLGDSLQNDFDMAPSSQLSKENYGHLEIAHETREVSDSKIVEVSSKVVGYKYSNVEIQTQDEGPKEATSEGVSYADNESTIQCSILDKEEIIQTSPNGMDAKCIRPHLMTDNQRTSLETIYHEDHKECHEDTYLIGLPTSFNGIEELSPSEIIGDTPKIDHGQLTPPANNHDAQGMVFHNNSCSHIQTGCHLDKTICTLAEVAFNNSVTMSCMQSISRNEDGTCIKASAAMSNAHSSEESHAAKSSISSAVEMTFTPEIFLSEVNVGAETGRSKNAVVEAEGGISQSTLHSLASKGRPVDQIPNKGTVIPVENISSGGLVAMGPSSSSNTEGSEFSEVPVEDRDPTSVKPLEAAGEDGISQSSLHNLVSRGRPNDQIPNKGTVIPVEDISSGGLVVMGSSSSSNTEGSKFSEVPVEDRDPSFLKLLDAAGEDALVVECNNDKDLVDNIEKSSPDLDIIKHLEQAVVQEVTENDSNFSFPKPVHEFIDIKVTAVECPGSNVNFDVDLDNMTVPSLGKLIVGSEGAAFSLSMDHKPDKHMEAQVVAVEAVEAEFQSYSINGDGSFIDALQFEDDNKSLEETNTARAPFSSGHDENVSSADVEVSPWLDHEDPGNLANAPIANQMGSHDNSHLSILTVEDQAEIVECTVGSNTVTESSLNRLRDFIGEPGVPEVQSAMLSVQFDSVNHDVASDTGENLAEGHNSRSGEDFSLEPRKNLTPTYLLEVGLGSERDENEEGMTDGEVRQLLRPDNLASILCSNDKVGGHRNEASAKDPVRISDSLAYDSCCSPNHSKMTDIPVEVKTVELLVMGANVATGYSPNVQAGSNNGAGPCEMAQSTASIAELVTGEYDIVHGVVENSVEVCDSQSQKDLTDGVKAKMSSTCLLVHSEVQESFSYKKKEEKIMVESNNSNVSLPKSVHEFSDIKVTAVEYPGCSNVNFDVHLDDKAGAPSLGKLIVGCKDDAFSLSVDHRTDKHMEAQVVSLEAVEAELRSYSINGDGSFIDVLQFEDGNKSLETNTARASFSSGRDEDISSADVEVSPWLDHEDPGNLANVPVADQMGYHNDSPLSIRTVEDQAESTMGSNTVTESSLNLQRDSISEPGAPEVQSAMFSVQFASVYHDVVNEIKENFAEDHNSRFGEDLMDGETMVEKENTIDMVEFDGEVGKSLHTLLIAKGMSDCGEICSAATNANSSLKPPNYQGSLPRQESILLFGNSASGKKLEIVNPTKVPKAIDTHNEGSSNLQSDSIKDTACQMIPVILSSTQLDTGAYHFVSGAKEIIAEGCPTRTCETSSRTIKESYSFSSQMASTTDFDVGLSSGEVHMDKEVRIMAEASELLIPEEAFVTVTPREAPYNMEMAVDNFDPSHIHTQGHLDGKITLLSNSQIDSINVARTSGEVSVHLFTPQREVEGIKILPKTETVDSHVCNDVNDADSASLDHSQDVIWDNLEESANAAMDILDTVVQRDYEMCDKISNDIENSDASEHEVKAQYKETEGKVENMVLTDERDSVEDLSAHFNSGAMCHRVGEIHCVALTANSSDKAQGTQGLGKTAIILGALQNSEIANAHDNPCAAGVIDHRETSSPQKEDCSQKLSLLSGSSACEEKILSMDGNSKRSIAELGDTSYDYTVQVNEEIFNSSGGEFDQAICDGQAAPGQRSVGCNVHEQSKEPKECQSVLQECDGKETEAATLFISNISLVSSKFKVIGSKEVALEVLSSGAANSRESDCENLKESSETKDGYVHASEELNCKGTFMRAEHGYVDGDEITPPDCSPSLSKREELNECSRSGPMEDINRRLTDFSISSAKKFGKLIKNTPLKLAKGIKYNSATDILVDKENTPFFKIGRPLNGNVEKSVHASSPRLPLQCVQNNNTFGK